MEQVNVSTIKENINTKLSRYFGITASEANESQIYQAVVLTVRDILSAKKTKWHTDLKKMSNKKIYYFSMEFLVGPSLKNNLHNLKLKEAYTKALKDLGWDMEELYKAEPDPGLGNGGLGRLASCFMDSMTTQNYPTYGFSICYEYGLFKQKIVDGNQIEMPDDWLDKGEYWLIPRNDKSYTITMGGKVLENWSNGRNEIIYENPEQIKAVPYDMMISGYDTDNVGTLRLWSAESCQKFDMDLFCRGNYDKAVKESVDAKTLSRVLYPSDNHTEGKILRLSQQYFLVSASLQSILDDHLQKFGTLDNLKDQIVIHINDTHPALCIPELMRLLMDEHGFGWEKAWNTVTTVISYTNHTVLPEALEEWDEGLFGLKLPRIHMIIKEINRRFCDDLWRTYPDNWEKISKMSIISYGKIRMANLSIVGSHKVNGVSKLHSDILGETIFKNYKDYTPNKFTNVTNGIAHRRWLCMANPKLSDLIAQCTSSDFITNPEKLIEFEKFKNDSSVHDKLKKIKRENKIILAKEIKERTGIVVDLDSVFDVQVKRIHEYKRQLLNLLKIIAMYNALKENPNADITPQTFIFAGKAAPSYYFAKDIIKLICEIAEDIQKHTEIRKKIQVVFLEDYNVSLGEKIFPASDISEQISLAGKEASGTGCMKFMINGALTVGTLDGANIEMRDAVGNENIYIFGLNSSEVNDIWVNGYNSFMYYQNNSVLRSAVNSLAEGWNGKSFKNIENYFLSGKNRFADPYMCLADFDAYVRTYERALSDYKDTENWYKKSVINIANAGYFSADRSINDYANNIWYAKKVK